MQASFDSWCLMVWAVLLEVPGGPTAMQIWEWIPNHTIYAEILTNTAVPYLDEVFEVLAVSVQGRAVKICRFEDGEAVFCPFLQPAPCGRRVVTNLTRRWAQQGPEGQ